MHFETYFKQKKVLVTGHTGFKGSWLISWLHLLGAEIMGYALAPENDFDLYSAINGDRLCSSVIADIRDASRLKEVILDFEPDFIFHLAAQPLVIESYRNPVYTFEVNVTGTANVLDALRFLEKPCVAVMITTDKVYHNDETGRPYKEDDRLGGHDPYSSSKAAAEIVIESYRKSFFNPATYTEHQKSVSAARAGNVIGGGDWAKDRIIPDIIRALAAGKKVEVRNPLAVRPWQHVLEPLSGYLTLAAKQTLYPAELADAFNFGPHKNDILIVRELVKYAVKYWGSGAFEETAQRTVFHEAGLLQLDIEKALHKLNWSPKLDAASAIESTIHWYKKNIIDGNNSFDLLVRDISGYSQKNA